MSDGDRAVIVEDDFLIRTYLQNVCEDLGVIVAATAGNPADGLAAIREAKPDFVLMDVRLGGSRDGVDVALDVFNEQPEVRMIFITGSNEQSTLDRIREDHPYRILIKPIEPEDLRAAFG